MQVVSSPENFKEIPARPETFSDLINFLRLLRLTSSLTKDDRTHDIIIQILCFTLHTNEASLFGVLQVVTMTLGDEPIDSLLNPDNLINDLISLLLHHLDGKPVFGVDYPYEKETVGLQLFKRNVIDNRVR